MTVQGKKGRAFRSFLLTPSFVFPNPPIVKFLAENVDIIVRYVVALYILLHLTLSLCPHLMF